MFFIIGIAAALVVIEVISSAFPSAGPVLYGIVSTLTVLYFLLAVGLLTFIRRFDENPNVQVVRAKELGRSSLTKLPDLEDEIRLRAVYLVNLMPVLIYVVASSQFLRYWNLVNGGFNAHGAGYWDWLVFGFTGVIENVFYSALQSLGLSLTSIGPVSATAHALVWAYNIILGLVIIAGVGRIISESRQMNKRIRSRNDNIRGLR